MNISHASTLTHTHTHTHIYIYNIYIIYVYCIYTYTSRPQSTNNIICTHENIHKMHHIHIQYVHIIMRT